jgi:F-type H+-transporting ATPase subunit epsilon
MNTFVLHLEDSIRYERIECVESFVGADRSGSFGILAGHERFMTSLEYGLARYRRTGEPWQYLALPRALLYFNDGELTVSTRRYLRDSDYQKMADALEQRLRQEEEALAQVRTSLRSLEEAMFRRLFELGRERAA